MNMNRTFLLLTLTGIIAGGLSGCAKKTAAGGGPPADMPVQVVVAEAKHQPVIESISLVGSLVADEMVEIQSEVDGAVEEILFKEGQRVKKGDLLFRLDETKYAAAVAEAEASFKLSEANLERMKALRDQGATSPQEYDQARATYEVNKAALDLKRRQLKDARIYAPFDGVMGARLVSPGQVIGKNATLGSIVAIDPIKVEFDVPERFIGQLELQQTIEIKLAAWPGQKFTGAVFFIAPRLDPDTRTALVKAALPNPDQKLKPGMFANLDLTLKVREQAVVVPEEALLLQENRVSVFVVDDDNKVQPRVVKVGLRMPGQVEITEGLQAGEKVVIEGTQKVAPGKTVKFAS